MQWPDRIFPTYGIGTRQLVPRSARCEAENGMGIGLFIVCLENYHCSIYMEPVVTLVSLRNSFQSDLISKKITTQIWTR
jgi:hypothetical protein